MTTDAPPGDSAGTLRERTHDPLRESLERFVGKPVSDSAVSVAPDPVNQPMIRHWAAAFEDANPVYTDPVAAAASRFGEVVAPPVMLQTWTMATPKITGIAQRGGANADAGSAGVLAAFDAAGFTGTLASNSEFEIERYLRIGEVVSARTVVESISDKKQTRLGAGYFLTWITTYIAGEGDVVGRQRFRILKFRPPAAGDAGENSGE
jgi:hypothetical protein